MLCDTGRRLLDQFRHFFRMRYHDKVARRQGNGRRFHSFGLGLLKRRRDGAIFARYNKPRRLRLPGSIGNRGAEYSRIRRALCCPENLCFFF